MAKQNPMPGPGERARSHGQASGQRPVVSEQRNDPTQRPRSEQVEQRGDAVEAAEGNLGGRVPEGRGRARTDGLERSDEEIQRASESGTSQAAKEKRASDDVGTQGRRKDE